MSAPDVPAPRRLSRAKWLDPRIIGGLVLVIACVVIGARVIGASQHTTPVLAAGHDLATGTVLTAADVVTVDVNLGDATGNYLGGGSVVTGRTLLQPLRAGELVAASVVGDPETGRVLVIPVSPDKMPPGVGHGSVIDLYLTTGDGADQRTEPVAQKITVQSVAAPASGGLSGAGSNGFQVAVLLPAAQADELIRTLPKGEAVVSLVSGPVK